ncbi:MULTISPECIES: hypothetical protein [Burkholderia cepacia complex]|uniref:Uncharacterized protein n=1 Tax=Burkholderia semiarida TaxID=2843303 RepID=A0ABW7L8J1_9BURK|nr:MULTISPECIES: hypothetical protein [Burkholderia cepacia complex]MCA8036359.1 hypothetical protein [Burkholderia arboris]
MDARLCPAPADEVVAIDGKSVRGSRSTNQRGIHLISAWASQLGVSLGQVCTADKSNEITAIPKLPDVLLLKSAAKPRRPASRIDGSRPGRWCLPRRHPTFVTFHAIALRN